MWLTPRLRNTDTNLRQNRRLDPLTKDGILRIEMPKSEKAKGGKSIPIETEQSS